MAITLKNPEVDIYSRELARIMGVSITQAISIAVREALEHRQKEREKDIAARKARIKKLVDEYNALPLRDTRTPDEILGYDENGLPS